VVFPESNRIERAFNVKNVEEYISRIDEMIERKMFFYFPMKSSNRLNSIIRYILTSLFFISFKNCGYARY